MKRITIIRLAVVTYIAAMIAMFLGVQKYIENKDKDRKSVV